MGLGKWEEEKETPDRKRLPFFPLRQWWGGRAEAGEGWEMDFRKEAVEWQRSPSRETETRLCWWWGWLNAEGLWGKCRWQGHNAHVLWEFPYAPQFWLFVGCGVFCLFVLGFFECLNFQWSSYIVLMFSLCDRNRVVHLHIVLSYVSGLCSKCRVSRSVVAVLGRKVEKMFSMIVVIATSLCLSFLFTAKKSWRSSQRHAAFFLLFFWVSSHCI